MNNLKESIIILFGFQPLKVIETKAFFLELSIVICIIRFFFLLLSKSELVKSIDDIYMFI